MNFNHVYLQSYLLSKDRCIYGDRELPLCIVGSPPSVRNIASEEISLRFEDQPIPLENPLHPIAGEDSPQRFRSFDQAGMFANHDIISRCLREGG